MKKILALVLITVFMISIAGCANKTEYDKLVDQKAAVEKKVSALSSNIDVQKKTIAARDMELKDLRSALKTAEAKVKNLEAQITISKTVKK